ncbi:hypothetical protein R1sor_015964 [Riccia sorocarpa]|uniref:Reverse transcriptase domain-containing protein n=1 Tax=Riccia sorocarpa TaxID=122646 RepID=A0ABD3HDP2_9MARC
MRSTYKILLCKVEGKECKGSNDRIRVGVGRGHRRTRRYTRRSAHILSRFIQGRRGNGGKREEVVSKIDKRTTEDDKKSLEEVPSDEFITRIVMEMPKKKSQGIDGVMIEILQIGWEFMREECFLMVQSFWDKKNLVGKDNIGIIKLIPKNDKKHPLKNWRPITLLTMTYKIMAKIIAVRLKDILPRLIDTQQMGFVAGRNIIDNILTLRLGQEWAQATNQDTIFVKLDFMKAYDRVAHGFLWDTLTTMGMGEETVQRIKGLVPLMRALREEEAHGNIQGLNIGDGKSLLHQLFVDDTGICITAEEAQFVKTWMKESGCEVPGPGKKFVYLGVSTSSPVDEKELSWGWNEEDNPKSALIAWERIAQPKSNGGLGWTRFKEMSDALNVRLVSRILEKEDVEWIHLA